MSRLPSPRSLEEQLERLRRELVELAYALECQGRLDSADLAAAVACRLGELTAPRDAALSISNGDGEGMAQPAGLSPEISLATP